MSDTNALIEDEKKNKAMSNCQTMKATINIKNHQIYSKNQFLDKRVCTFFYDIEKEKIEIF